jgi:carbamoyltransferase
MTNGRFEKLFGGPARKPESNLEQRHMDIAKSIQAVTEEVVLKMAKAARVETGEKYLCMAGGVALNCVANGALLRKGIFENIWIQPAAGDAGGALGSAMSVWHSFLKNPRRADGKTDFQRGSYLGPLFTDDEIEADLKRKSRQYVRLEREKLIERVAELVDSEKVIGLCQGRMEFGPRALGNRSIIGDARSSNMQKVMNLKIKYRESFRPFAPSVAADRVSDFFDFPADKESPYMLLVADVAEAKVVKMTSEQEKLFGIDKLNIPRSTIPAITHVDYSARLQTVSRRDNPFYYDVIKEFDRRTGCPVIVNTSFNVRGEPIVCTPEDAYRCFMRTEMDYLVLGSCLLDKKVQPNLDKDSDWRKEFVLD